jgi:hypothetical protein
MMTEEEEIQKFNKLIPKAAQVHEYTFCVVKNLKIKTLELKGEICVKCKEFILRGGICDPL